MNSSSIESGSPTDDPRAFRRCLGQYATGVAVMTACDGQLQAGMSANSFAALSLDPPLVLWSIRRNSASLPVFQAATHYAVNVLAADQAPVAMRFATPAQDKFESVRWTPGLGQAALIDGCLAHFECRLQQVIEGGDHLILVGLVERYTRFEGEPLLFSQGRYALPREHPESGQPMTGTHVPDSGGLPFSAQEVSLMRIANYASGRLTARFDDAQAGNDLGRSEFRLLAWLRHAPRSVEQLVMLTYLGQREVLEGLDALLSNGHVVQQGEGLFNLTASGHSYASDMASRVTEFEQDLLKRVATPEANQIRDSLVRLACLVDSQA